MSIAGLTLDEISARIRTAPSVILVSVMFTQDWPVAQQIIKMLKTRFPQALLLAGGEHITAFHRESMDMCPEIDLCALGEGEETLREIIAHIKAHGTLPQECASTVIRKNGSLCVNPRRAQIRDLDSIARPKWDHFPIDTYLDRLLSFGVALGRTIPVVASRGCPYTCTFCSSKDMWTTLWRHRSAKGLADEIEHYVKRYRVSNIDFYDLTTIINRSWIIELCQEIIDRKLNITWQLPSGTRAEAIDEEVAQYLYRAGCKNLCFAPESGSPRVLEIIRKKLDLNRLLVSMAACVRQNINSKANLIIGFPGEKHTDVFATFLYIIRMAWAGLHEVSVNQYTPYPGSDLYEELRQKNGIDTGKIEYYITLSYYSSMTNVIKNVADISPTMILIYKYSLTGIFFLLSFLFNPGRIFRICRNVFQNRETIRLEKTLISYKNRLLPGFSQNRKKASV